MNQPTPKPIFTTVPVKGLKKDFKILHFTDLHACALDEVEKAAMEPAQGLSSLVDPKLTGEPPWRVFPLPQVGS